jgi:hypothetical protein
MKNSYVLIIALCVTVNTLRAQIPNAGFENWTAYGNGMIPDGWWTSNDSLSSTGTYFPVTRSTDHYPVTVGGYSIRLENNPLLSPDWAKAGIAWTGEWNGNNYPVFPVTGHPVKLCGYYKFLPQNGDTMDIHFVLYQNGLEITLGSFKSTDTVAAWTAFNILVSDTNYASADSARIIICAFNTDNFLAGIHGNSVLYVDNLSFDSLITSPQLSVTDLEVKTGLFTFYPNPATDFVTLDITGNGAPKTVLNIYNLTGVPVETELIRQNNQDINFRYLNNGIYILEMRSGDNTERQKLIIDR